MVPSKDAVAERMRDLADHPPEGVDIYSLDNAPVSREVQQIDWDIGVGDILPITAII